MKKYTSVWNFLKKTPKNLASVVIIWTMATLGVVMFSIDHEQTERFWVIFFYVFMATIYVLGWLRIWLLYKRNS